ncbi:MAG: hypothetical protein DDG59_00665 [Anaerolineae bacterium]|jgi:pimeloyl-ACP methyl ester carboxylesterase|nr:MAG: hypothetical protein DDG59_00665 [Anaerolineae bacterium]
MTFQARFVEINSHSLYCEYFSGGNLPLLILLHHGLGSSEAWRAQFECLRDGGFSVLAYDRWGYGRSDDRGRLDPPYFEEDVRDLETLLSKETKPRILIGHSDGANVALTYASRHPEHLLGAVVVAPHIYFEPKMAEGIQGLWRAYQENQAFQKGLQRVHGGKAVFERWFQSWTQLGADWDMRQTLSTIQCPVLVIQGSEDEHATVQHAKDCAAALPNGQVQIVEGADHMLPQKSSEIFNQLLLQSIGEFQRMSQHVQ